MFEFNEGDKWLKHNSYENLREILLYYYDSAKTKIGYF